ncbi:hypothetical protein EJ082_05860 [Brevundimonas diminuta]|jgi:hypothetical protein|uniref:Uncharacterized protein n=1 Tax=Brevundimonas diminuta TaxID=293 RepID=A0A410NYP2_BREDI|nr:ABC-three component system middle component 5 [Brevundimonas diminuta]MBD3572504.1 hypothetical protein [Brevundimonas diminuta]MBD3817831.1 hypothetical protein [Brevundimonas diminuta]QAT15018.1 hypothetical protein EQG53_11950 [Brevundimonas diminuta]QQB87601.1 hypothetical protein I6H83_10495 [Brevundimonas diminuta]WQE46721.1 ABC-three component system middle component 5 [Brevundimonas diminuta]
MIQIAYQPAYDAFHTIFRFFQLAGLEISDVETDRYRILDYYLCFPSELAHFRFPPKHTRFRKLGERFAQTSSYERRPSAQLILGRMRPVQAACLETLEAKGFLVVGELDRRRIVRTVKPSPTDLAARIGARWEQQAELGEALRTIASEYPLLGPQGLKARSELLEHKYDAI